MLRHHLGHRHIAAIAEPTQRCPRKSTAGCSAPCSPGDRRSSLSADITARARAIRQRPVRGRSVRFRYRLVMHGHASSLADRGEVRWECRRLSGRSFESLTGRGGESAAVGRAAGHLVGRLCTGGAVLAVGVGGAWGRVRLRPARAASRGRTRVPDGAGPSTVADMSGRLTQHVVAACTGREPG